MSFFCNPFLLQHHQFFLEANLAKPKCRAAGAAGICGSSFLSFLSDIGFIAAAAEQDVSEEGRDGVLDDEREARARERSHVISSLCACFLASSSASSSSAVVLPAAAEAGAESRWMEGRKEGAAAAAHSKLRSNSRRIFYFFGSSFSFTFSTT
jgi:hypothetical protein